MALKYSTIGGGDVSSYNSNGFTVSYNNSRTNQSAGTYAAWLWKKGSTPGFDVVTYTAPATNVTANIPHNAGGVPAFIMTKSRSSASFNWCAYLGGYTTNTQFLRISQADAKVEAGVNVWGNHTSSTFGVVGDQIVVANTACVAYVWTEVPGFSKFGTYTGNSNADGPFVHTGFKPAFVIIKNGSAGANFWNLMDNKRNPNNGVTNRLYPNAQNLDETGGPDLDFLSNGFKIRQTGNSNQNSGDTFVYLAFAEMPFKYSLAR